MTDSWALQQVQRVSNWYFRYWLVPSYKELLGVNVDDVESVFSKPALDKIINDDGNTVFKNDRTTTVVRVKQWSDDCVLKRYNARNTWHKFKRAFRRSRAYRCWLMSYQFQSAGLNVAQPIMMFEQRIGPIRKDTYFVNQYLAGPELLDLLPKMSGQDQEEVAQAVKEAFNKMQAHKLTHGDMKASNLLWLDKQLYFIDLDAARQHANSFSWQAAHNKDRKRFLKNWSEQPKIRALFAQSLN